MNPSNHEELLYPFLLMVLPALVILVFGFVRGRLTPAIGLLAIVVMPASSFTLGNVVLMERAKSVEFCASCHEMATVVFAAHEQKSDLAAVHFRSHFPRRQGCYTCHSGYGIWGDLDAKIAGISHMWATFTNSASFPIKHAGPFDVAGCLKCHAQADGFLRVPSHTDPKIRAAIDAGELGCSGSCHAPAHDPASLVRPHRGPIRRLPRPDGARTEASGADPAASDSSGSIPELPKENAQ